MLATKHDTNIHHRGDVMEAYVLHVLPCYYHNVYALLLNGSSYVSKETVDYADAAQNCHSCCHARITLAQPFGHSLGA